MCVGFVTVFHLSCWLLLASQSCVASKAAYCIMEGKSFFYDNLVYIFVRSSLNPHLMNTQKHFMVFGFIVLWKMRQMNVCIVTMQL